MEIRWVCSRHASKCAAEWVGGIFCLPDAAWLELIPLKAGKVRTGAVCKRFPLSHENSIAVPAVRLCRSLPPKSGCANDTTLGPGLLGAGQRLASVVIRPQHPPLYRPTLLPFTHSLTHTPLPSEHSEPKVLTCLGATIRAMFWVIYNVHFSGWWQ